MDKLSAPFFFWRVKPRPSIHAVFCDGMKKEKKKVDSRYFPTHAASCVVFTFCCRWLHLVGGLFSSWLTLAVTHHRGRTAHKSNRANR